jgi:hypothetical protein
VQKFFEKTSSKNSNKLGNVVHACNPRYLIGGVKRIVNVRLPLAKR